MRFIIYVFVFGFLFSCKDPNFPLQPQIAFKAIRYDANTQNIVVDLDFTDGDGDMGLNENDITGIFDPEFVDQIIKDTLLVNSRKNPSLDSLVITPVDTISVISNENHFNYLASIVFKSPNGTFKECKDIPNCLTETLQNSRRISAVFRKTYQLDSLFREGSFGRYPRLGNEDRKSPISGVLTYNITAGSLAQILRGKTIKFKIKLKDRALNTSNEVLSDSLAF